MAPRSIAIIISAVRLSVLLTRERWREASLSESEVPSAFVRELQKLGPTFIKFGQALALRRDLLPEEWLRPLKSLHEGAQPFSAAEAKLEFERALGESPDHVFADFEAAPFAAASIAQVHKARMKDGRCVVVKVRRPGIRRQIDRDMRFLVHIARLLTAAAPSLRQFQPIRVLEEMRTNLQKECDFLREARSAQRFADQFRDWPSVHVPGVIIELVRESILVQEMSSGRHMGEPAQAQDGPRIARELLRVYLHQFLVTGIFHADPHPGNLFIMPDGSLCFHDFGLVGFLDHPTRLSLAVFLQAFVAKDAAWMVDAALALGVLRDGGDRARQVQQVDEILGEYSTLPLQEWSIGEVFLKMARLSADGGVALPFNLVVFMRATFLVESALRTLDPQLQVLDALISEGAAALEEALGSGLAARSRVRLKVEAASFGQRAPTLFASWLHDRARNKAEPLLNVGVPTLDRFGERFEAGLTRLSFALVAVGLFIAASLLMLHSVGPRVWGDLPLLGVVGYLWAGLVSWRVLRKPR